jgi:hypothetical protein
LRVDLGKSLDQIHVYALLTLVQFLQLIS